MKKIENDLKLTIYNKGGATWYCDYYFFNGSIFERGTTKASGYGYDKESTAASEAINKFKVLYNLKRTIKFESAHSMHATDTKTQKEIYGIYSSKEISYGIGLSSVINCLKAFSNVKLIDSHYGRMETFLHLKIKTTETQLQKELERQEKQLKKAEKWEKKHIKTRIELLQKILKGEE